MRTATLDLDGMVDMEKIKSELLSRFRYSVQSPHLPAALRLPAEAGLAGNDPGAFVWAMFRIATYVVMERFGPVPAHVEAVAGDAEGIPWVAMLLDMEPLAVLFGMTPQEWGPLAEKYKPSGPDAMDADYREMTQH